MSDKVRTLSILLKGDGVSAESAENISRVLMQLNFVQAVSVGEAIAPELIAASDFRVKVGRLIAEIALSRGEMDSMHQRAFMDTVRGAYARLMEERGAS